MKKIVLLKSSVIRGYRQQNFSPENAQYGILIAFLNDDASLTNAIPMYRQSLSGCCNATCIYVDGDDVHIEFSFKVEGRPECIIPKQAFLQILDAWEKVLKDEPDQVVITLYDDRSATIDQIFEEKE